MWGGYSVFIQNSRITLDNMTLRQLKTFVVVWCHGVYNWRSPHWPQAVDSHSRDQTSHQVTSSWPWTKVYKYEQLSKTKKGVAILFQGDYFWHCLPWNKKCFLNSAVCGPNWLNLTCLIRVLKKHLLEVGVKAILPSIRRVQASPHPLPWGDD